MLTLDLLIQVFQAYVWFSVISFISQNEYKSALSLLVELTLDIKYIALIFYPIGGLIADTWVGRYRMIVCSMVFSFLIWIMFVTDTKLNDLDAEGGTF